MGMRRLGATEFEITPIGLGCMQFAGRGIGERYYPALEKDTVTSIVRSALDGGVNWFDTAEMYGRGNSERSLTTALRDLGAAPGKVVIATKWTPWLRKASSIGATIGDRLASLQGYPVDLHQIHMPYGSLSSVPSQLRAMADLVDAGTVTSVGVSNFSARQMELASHLLRSRGLSLASNQVQISLLHRKAERDGTLDAARRLGVTLIAFGPLRSGLLTGKFHEDPERIRSIRGARRALAGFNAKTLARTAPLIDELRAIGRAYGVTISQVGLTWLITFYGDTVVAIPGASKPRQATESAAAMDLRLTRKELDRLDELSRTGEKS
ncbi:aldo/keto reductase [Actinopolymorpha alba]|uniref:aldo/keto reductase n=1 Tax=Actinopolymorpha alba TaxID=533267 RepID=UPI0003763A04|nr:aldo/keto reductase [Actinopolymorpha alba]